MRLRKRLSKAAWLAALLLACACNTNNKPAESVPPTEDKNETKLPQIIFYDIVKEYQHDPASFTEGLEYRDSCLYESTGEYGSSQVRKTDLRTGKVLLSQKMEGKYFGEGLTVLGGRVYQLTYREGTGFIYNAKTLKKEGTFTFSTPEGWGMTNNGADLIYDDGGNILHYIDPHTFKEVRQLAVTDEQGAVKNLNELEIIKGYLYANQWQTDNILKIDTATGRVVARADLGTLRERGGIPPISGRPHTPEVLNGIAYDAAANRIFVTGKNWPKVFEIKLDN